MMATNDRPVVAGFSLRFASPAAAIRRLKPATTNAVAVTRATNSPDARPHPLFPISYSPSPATA